MDEIFNGYFPITEGNRCLREKFLKEKYTFSKTIYFSSHLRK